MKFQIMFLAVSLLAVGLPAQAQTDERVVTGAVVRVQAESRIMTLSDTRTRVRTKVSVPSDATITMDGKPAKLEEFKRGTLATVRYIKHPDGTNRAVSARVPNPLVVVEVPTAVEQAASGMQSVAMPKTASNRYLPLGVGLAFLLMGFGAFAVRKLTVRI